MRIFIKLLVFVLLFIGSRAAGQVFQFASTQGNLQIEVLASNPCLQGATFVGGYIEFKVLSTPDGLPARLNTIIRDGGPPHFFNQVSIAVGSSFIFYGDNTGVPGGSSFTPALIAGVYNFYIDSSTGSEFVNGFATPIQLQQLSDIQINEVLVQNNTDCDLPLDGNVIASVTGGSLDLVGGTPPPGLVGTESSFTYTWNSTNGLPGLPLTGTWDGTTNLDLTALLGLPGLPGGTYQLLVEDNYSSCSEQRSFIITDPTPAIQNVLAPFNKSVCVGSDITVQLDNTEAGVNYEILRNGVVPALFTFPGTGPGTFTMTFPSTSFSTGDVIVVRAVDGFCSPITMNNTVNLTILPLPTATVSGGGTICTGGTLPNIVFTFTGTAPFTFTYTDGTTPVTVTNHNSTTYTIANAAPGTYQLTSLTDANSCSATSLGGTATVVVNALPTAAISGGGPVCFGSPLPNVIFSFTGIAPYTFTYSNGGAPITVTNHPSATFIIPNAPVGTYTITALTDANACAATDLGTPVAVSVNPLPTATVGGGGAICTGGTLPDVTFTFTGTAPFTFTYTDGTTPVTVTGHLTTTYTITGATAGTYSVVSLTDANLCAATSLGGTANVVVNPLPTAAIAGGGPVCAGAPLPGVTFTFTGTAPFTFTYNNGGAPVTVNNHPSTTFTIANAPTGTYTITALTDANTCVATDLGTPVAVTVNALPTATTSGGATICTGGTLPDVTFTFTGTAPFNFTYTDGTTPVTITNHPATIYTITGAAAGAYSVTALTDANGCAATDFGATADVVINPLPTATISGGGAACVGSPLPTVTFTFTGTAPFTFTYNNGGAPITVNNHPTNTFAISTAPVGTYTITALTDANTCIGTSLGTPVAVSTNVLPTASVSGGGTVCAGETLPDITFTFTGTAPFNFTYTNGGAPITVTNHPSTTFTITAAAAGTYAVTALTDANGCAATDFGTTAAVVVDPLPTATLSGGGPVCAGSPLPDVTINFTGTAPFTFTYTDGVTPVTITNHPANSYVIASAGAGTYSVTALTDANTCLATSLGTPVSVILNALPTAAISGGGTVCSGAPLPNVTFTFTGTAPFTFTYNNGGAPVTVSNHPSNTFVIANAPAGTYAITALADANSCPAAVLGTPAVVSVTPLPTALVSGGGTTCTGGTLPDVTFTFTGTAPFNFTYTDGTTPVTVTGHNSTIFTIAGAAAGTYSVTALTDANTCSAASLGTPVNVVVNALPTAALSGGGPVCEEATLPAVTFTFTGTAPFTFTYNDGGAPVTVTDHPASTFVITNAAAGTYTITSLTDANTCAATDLGTPVSVIVNPLPTATVSGGGAVCAGTAPSAVTFTFTGTAPFTFTYSDGTTPVTVSNHPNPTFVIAAPTDGTYSVTSLTDASTCPATSFGTPVVVDTNELPAAVISGGGAVCTGQTVPDVVFTFTGTAPFTFTYTDGTTPVTVNNHPTATFTITAPPAGTYSVTALTDANTCNATSLGTPVAVSINPLPTITPGTIAAVCEGTASVSMPFTTTGTADRISIDFDGDAQTAGFVDVVNATFTPGSYDIDIPVGVGAGTYNATVTVSNSTTTCVSASQPITITVNPSPTATITGPASICAGTPAQLTVTFTGTGPWAFTYSDGTTTSSSIPSFFNTINVPVGSPAATTTYTIMSVSDATACAGIAGSTHLLTVNQPPLTNLTVSTTIDPLCSGGSSDVTVANSELGVSYQLRNNADDSNIGSPVVGTGGLILLPTGSLTANTTFNVLATSGGCTPAELTNTVTITVAGSITAGLSVTADSSPICAGSGTNITIGASENGVLYQLRDDATNTNIGSPVAGTGSSISLPTGNLTATTVFNVLATNGTCSIELANTATVTVGASPDATLAVTVALDPLCSGGSTEVNVALSQAGVSYQLRNDADDSNVGTAVEGTGGTISLSTGILTANTTFYVLATAPGCTAIELTTLATVNVSGTIDATLALSAAASPICAGTGTDIELANSEAGVTYQLRNDATNASIGPVVTGTGGTILFPTGNLAATTAFNILASNGACSIELTDIETVNVDVAPDPALLLSATLNPLCVGGITSVSIQSSQTGVSYQLRNDADDSNIGPAVTGTGGTILLPTGALSATTSFNVLATSGVCTPVEMATVVSVTVSGTVDASLTVGSSSATICAGTSTFIQVIASESGVNYQLVNLTSSTPVGSPVAGTGATLNLPSGNLTTSSTFGVIANNGSCSILLVDNETITVNPSPDLTLAVTAAQTLICSNAITTITIANSQVGISYQLRNDAGDVNIGTPVAGTGSSITISTGALTANTTFNVLAMAGTCSAELNTTATVTIRPVGDPACGGSGGTDCTNFSAIQPSIVTQPSCNDRDAGEVSFNISRADATPTTFRILWTINGNTQTKFTSSTASFDDLSSGLYQYTVIDEGNGKVCGPVDFFLDLKTQVEILDKQVSSNVTCYGGTDGNAILTVDGTTTGEYWYRYVVGGVESTAQTFTPGAPLPGGLPADDNNFIIIKVDDNFNFTCPDTVMVRVKHTYAKIDFAVAATDVTTCNGTDGSINVSGIAGGDSGSNPLQVRLKKAVPFSTDPSGYIVVSDFADVAGGVKAYTSLSQGNYIVDVRDHLDCIQSKPIAVQAPGQVPLAVVSITAIDATCDNAGESGAIRVTISEAGIYKVAISQDQLNVPADSEFIDYISPSLPNVTFANLSAGAYYLYIKSNTTTCPTRTDAIMINGVKALGDFEVLSNCSNVNLTINNITGQQDRPFVIRVFSNNDKFFKIDSLATGSIPLSNSVTFTYAPPQHTFLNTPGTYRFVMVQTQTTGAGTCTLRSDTIVYTVRELLGITLGTVKPSFPEPKHTGSIEIANVTGGTRFIGTNNELYYEISLTTADDDIVIKDWEKLRLDPQNKFIHLYDYLPPGVYRIKVRDAGGCIKTLDVEIPLETGIFVPNIFTPNNDGINDDFEILNLPLTGTHHLIITNRWGNEVFKSGDYREGNFWNADNVADGIYYYRLKVDGGETLHGWVEIVRGSKP